MNRRDFLKSSGLLAAGALAAKLGLPVPQALAQGGVVECALKPSGERIVCVTPVDWELIPDEEIVLALSPNSIIEYDVNPTGPVGSPIFMETNGTVTTVETDRFVGYIVGEGFNKDQVGIGIATIGLAVTESGELIAP